MPEAWPSSIGSCSDWHTVRATNRPRPARTTRTGGSGWSCATPAGNQRALALGARLLRDDSQDEIEPIYVYADPAGHPFCIFVAPVPEAAT